MPTAVSMSMEAYSCSRGSPIVSVPRSPQPLQPLPANTCANANGTQRVLPKDENRRNRLANAAPYKKKKKKRGPRKVRYRDEPCKALKCKKVLTCTRRSKRCPYCAEWIHNHSRNFNTHLNTHGKGILSKCVVCDQTFVSDSNLKSHIRTSATHKKNFDDYVQLHGCPPAHISDKVYPQQTRGIPELEVGSPASAAATPPTQSVLSPLSRDYDTNAFLAFSPSVKAPPSNLDDPVVVSTTYFPLDDVNTPRVSVRSPHIEIGVVNHFHFPPTPSALAAAGNAKHTHPMEDENMDVPFSPHTIQPDDLCSLSSGARSPSAISIPDFGFTDRSDHNLWSSTVSDCSSPVIGMPDFMDMPSTTLSMSDHTFMTPLE